MEVFAGTDAKHFLENKENEGKPTHITIAAGTQAKKKYPQAPSSASVTPFSRNAKTVVELVDPNDTGAWVQVKEKIVVGEVKKAWLHDKYPDRREYRSPLPP